MPHPILKTQASLDPVGEQPPAWRSSAVPRMAQGRYTEGPRTSSPTPASPQWNWARSASQWPPAKVKTATTPSARARLSSQNCFKKLLHKIAMALWLSLRHSFLRTSGNMGGIRSAPRYARIDHCWLYARLLPRSLAGDPHRPHRHGGCRGVRTSALRHRHRHQPADLLPSALASARIAA